MAKMAHSQTSQTVIPVALKGQAGEVQGEQRQRLRQIKWVLSVYYVAWLLWTPQLRNSALFLRKGCSHERFRTSLSTAFSFWGYPDCLKSRLLQLTGHKGFNMVEPPELCRKQEFPSLLCHGSCPSKECVPFFPTKASAIDLQVIT